MKKFGSSFLYIVVVLVAIATGFFCGNSIVDKHFEDDPYSNIDGNSLYDDATLIDYQGKTPDQLSAVEAYVVANYLVDNSDYYLINNSGTMETSVGINQTALSTDKKDGDCFETVMFTYSKMLKNAQKITYQKGGSVSILHGNVNGPEFSDTTFDGKREEYTFEQFKEKAGPIFESNNPYIVSSKTIVSSSACTIDNGQYTFSIVLDNVKSVINYAKQVAYFADVSGPVNFSKVEMKFSLDKDFKFVTRIKEEEYTINYMGIQANVKSCIESSFKYSK